MKVYLSVDMEGIAGITEYSEIDPHSEKYPAARRWMTQNVNAAVAGDHLESLSRPISPSHYWPNLPALGVQNDC